MPHDLVIFKILNREWIKEEQGTWNASENPSGLGTLREMLRRMLRGLLLLSINLKLTLKMEDVIHCIYIKNVAGNGSGSFTIIPRTSKLGKVVT